MHIFSRHVGSTSIFYPPEGTTNITGCPTKLVLTVTWHQEFVHPWFFFTKKGSVPHFVNSSCSLDLHVLWRLFGGVQSCLKCDVDISWSCMKVTKCQETVYKFWGIVSRIHSFPLLLNEPKLSFRNAVDVTSQFVVTYYIVYYRVCLTLSATFRSCCFVAAGLRASRCATAIINNSLYKRSNK